MSAALFAVRPKPKRRISPQKREELVRGEAWRIFLELELGRRGFNWLAAIDQCGLTGVYVGTTHPRRAEVVAKAEENWLRRKDRDELLDWSAAEAIINREYEVV